MPKLNPAVAQADLLHFTTRAIACFATIGSGLAEITVENYDTFVARIVAYVLIPSEVVLYDGR